MRMFRDVVAFLLGWFASLLLLVAPAFAVPANTITQPTPKWSPVNTGVGAPRTYIDTFDSGGELLTDGTNPVLVLWGQVVQVSCDGLAAGERVLVCFSMHIDAVPDVTDAQLSDGTLDAEGHCMMLTNVNPTDDMRLEVTRFYQNDTEYAGAQFVGACDRNNTAYHLAPCSVAGEATDCGAASTCDTGAWRSTATDSVAGKRAIDMIAGAWIIADSSAATEECTVRVDL